MPELKVLVNNKSESQHGYRVRAERKDEWESFTVHPGVNMIDARLWDLAKAKTITQHRIEEEIYVIASEGVAADANPLKALKERDAIKLVKETVLDDLLETWQAKEVRPKVKKALEEQIAALDLTKKPAE